MLHLLEALDRLWGQAHWAALALVVDEHSCLVVDLKMAGHAADISELLLLLHYELLSSSKSPYLGVR